jgi:hypothetical protein
VTRREGSSTGFVVGHLRCSVVHSTAALVKLDVLRMDNSEMPRESIIPAEGFFFGADRTVHLLFTRVVDRVFMASEIVRPREDGVAGLSR